ncbi:MAG: hypothetical protein HOA17_09865 [Candidatus Melainabacteria bacterium]|jgi:molecular chaperone GrpE (heat shock protein)|nr:hypothetical protein [Candidatus Melainabacteria bacterium]
MTAGVKSQLRSAISSVQSKASEVASGVFSQDVAADKATQSQSIVRIKENVASSREKDLDNTMEKLNPPPTKDVDSGGKNGGTKTVVDKEEVARLEGQKNNLQGQLEIAKSDVEDAKSEASNASTAALEKAGITKEKQSEMSSLLSQIDSINNSLSEGGKVSEDEIKEITDKVTSFSNNLNADNRQIGAITKAFLNPVKKGLEKILKHVQQNPASVESSGQVGAPPTAANPVPPTAANPVPPTAADPAPSTPADPGPPTAADPGTVSDQATTNTGADSSSDAGSSEAIIAPVTSTNG